MDLSTKTMLTFAILSLSSTATPIAVESQNPTAESSVTFSFCDTRSTLTMRDAPTFIRKRNYIERYKRIVKSDNFKRAYSGMSLGEIVSIDE